MSNTQVHQGRFRRLVNRQKPIQLFNFIKVKVLRLRHRHGKPFGTSPTSAQDSAGHSPVFVDQNIPRTRNTKHDLTSLDDSEANNEQQGHGRLSKPTASQPYSSKNIHELIEFAGLKAASIQGCIGTASPKDAPFLEFQLVFGAGSPSSNIHCYRARAPRQVGHTNAWEYANDSDLWSPEEQPLKRSDRNTLRPTDRALACPYLMQDPTTYESRQGCRGAAFHDVSRLKEHLYRCHRQKPHCTKCGEPFVDEASQANHEVCSSDFVDSVSGKFLQEFKGFNKEQEAKLKDKKRKRGGSKVAKWKDIFDILFPDAIEVPCPYYKPPAFQQFQDSAVERRDMMHDLINNLFKNHVSGSIARSQVEKMKGPMTEEDWSKMKEIFRSFVLSDVKASRTTAAGDMNQDFSKSTEAIESQISVCGSSTSSTSHQVSRAKRNARPSNMGDADHQNNPCTVLNLDHHRTEAPDNSQEPDLADTLPSNDIDLWLADVGDVLRVPNRRSPPHQPDQAGTSSKSQPAHQSSQPSPPSRHRPANQSNQSIRQSESSQSGTSADKVNSAREVPSSTQEAAEDAIHTHQEATAETCEETFFNNLNLTPEECLAAALQQKTPPWRGPEYDSSHD